MSNSLPQNALVLVADGGKAMLLRNQGPHDQMHLNLERELTHKDFTDDGPSGSRPDETPHQTEEATFAKQLAKLLSAMKESGAYKDLVLIADPHTLGEIRAALHKNVEGCIVLSLAKDLTNHSPKDIDAALSK